MAITRPTGIVSTSLWGNPVADEINRLTTESAANKTNLASIETSLNQLLQPQWKTLPLATGWDWFGSGQQTPNYAKWGNWAFLRGMVKNISGAAISANTVYSTVPSEVLPPLNGLCAVQSIMSPSNNTTSIRNTMQSNGNFNVLVTAQRPIPNQQWFTLEGVGFFLG